MEKALSLPKPSSSFSYPNKKKREPPGYVFPEHSPVQEGIAKGVQLPERFLGIHHQGIPRDDALHLSVHHSNEGVGGRLRPNPHAWEILLQEVPGRGSTVIMQRFC